MKKLLLFTFTLLCFYHTNAQTDLDGRHCDNVNSFLENGVPEGLSGIADHVDTKTGMVMINPNAWLESFDINSFANQIDLNSDYTFELKKEITIRKTTYAQYQQLYKGIKVENGGFTIAYLSNNPNDDCPEVYMMSLGVITGLEDIKTEVIVKESSIKDILESSQISEVTYPFVNPVSTPSITSEIQKELYLSITANDDCIGRLVWKAEYIQEGAKVSWIDAKTGEVLKIIDGYVGLSAPVETESYADPNLSDPDNGIFRLSLDDSTIDDVTSLISFDERVKTCDYSDILPLYGHYLLYPDAFIPKTTNSFWTNESTSHVFQTHHALTQALPIFDNIGISFEIVYAAGTTYSLSGAFKNSSTDTAYIFMGFYNNATSAVYDGVAHELGHAHLFDFIDSEEIGEETLHEAIADMIATYVESEIQGVVDWVIGDDELGLAEALNRDFSIYSCVDDVSEGNQYVRGNPLRHLFYLISKGSTVGLHIPELGVERALTLILDGVYMLGEGIPDYETLQAATLMQAELNYGLCSDEYLALFRAWDRICLPADPVPCYTLSSKKIVCEEDGNMEICINGGAPPYDNYHWYFPLEWTVLGTTEGNRFDGRCLTVTEFPDYDYYPQSFIVYVRHSNTEIDGGLQRVRVVLEDCDGNDDDCYDFLSALVRDKNISHLVTDNNNETFADSRGNLISKVKVFDIMGRIIYDGEASNFNLDDFSPNPQLLLISTFNVEGQLIGTKKIINFN